jgi:KDO2-lipid IV(A) lauroyltransferase
VEVQFFGRRTFFPGGPAFIARRAGVPLFVGMEVADPAGPMHQAMIEPPIEVPRTPDIEHDVQRTTQAIAGVFERYIAAHPEQWVMFHRIWS